MIQHPDWQLFTESLLTQFRSSVYFKRLKLCTWNMSSKTWVDYRYTSLCSLVLYWFYTCMFNRWQIKNSPNCTTWPPTSSYQLRPGQCRHGWVRWRHLAIWPRFTASSNRPINAGPWNGTNSHPITRTSCHYTTSLSDTKRTSHDRANINRPVRYRHLSN